MLLLQICIKSVFRYVHVHVGQSDFGYELIEERMPFTFLHDFVSILGLLIH